MVFKHLKKINARKCLLVKKKLTVKITILKFSLFIYYGKFNKLNVPNTIIMHFLGIFYF
jgi:hypothetical protein